MTATLTPEQLHAQASAVFARVVEYARTLPADSRFVKVGEFLADQVADAVADMPDLPLDEDAMGVGLLLAVAAAAAMKEAGG